MELNARAAALAMLILFGFVFPARSGLCAQVARDEPTQIVLNGSLGRHGLGVGFEVPLWNGLGIAARAEGVGFPQYSIVAAGARVDVMSSEEARAYALGLLGMACCRNEGLGASSRRQDGEATAAVGVLGGAEILLGTDGAWSAGLEAGYWFAVRRDAASRDLDHLAFSAMLRWRP